MPRIKTANIFSFFRLIYLLRSNDDEKNEDIAKGQGLCVSELQANFEYL